MPLEKAGKIYLSVGESAELLDISRTTFGVVRETYGLKSKRFPGKGRSEFYLKEVLELIQHSSTDDAESVKKRIQELQQASQEVDQ